MPLGESGTSTQPVNSPAAFHIDWPWRIKMSSDMEVPHVGHRSAGHEGGAQPTSHGTKARTTSGKMPITMSRMNSSTSVFDWVLVISSNSF